MQDILAFPRYLASQIQEEIRETGFGLSMESSMEFETHHKAKNLI
jgi:hypothetical protein